MLLQIFKFAFVLALAAVLFLALTVTPWAGMVESDTVRHGFAFLVLPVLATIGWPRLSPWGQFAIFAGFGAAIELVQGYMAIGRVASLDDWIVDLIALSAALLAMEVLALRHRVIAVAAPRPRHV
ncbi:MULTISPECIES: hypothetical protein [unclassified Sphingomonas]|uniref:hypothetical protein n=1 Tax=unclassified Sphingomonas TaxID=196159 RepID=UPI0008376A22|nr:MULTISPECIES: hypothetical protein [unclassified Sphingomonas]